MNRAPESDLLVGSDPRRLIDEVDDALGKSRTTKRKVRDWRKPPKDKPTIRVVPIRSGRLSGWGVKCSEHGTLGPAVNEPLMIPKKSGARAAAVDHGREHPEGATLVVPRKG